MRADLLRDVLPRLLADYDFKEKGEWLQQGRCPACGKRELYAKADSPWLLKCGRENKCAAQLHIKDLYPDLFERWSERFPASAESPTAAADAYLRDGRGFPLARLAGCYTQEYHHDRKRGIGSATVRFALPGGGWWERIIDQPQRFERKANFAYGKSYHGQWWQLPGGLEAGDELWLAEGIFDCIALELAGLPARSLMSCNNYPDQALAALKAACQASGQPLPKLVWALDDGAAGTRYMKQWHQRARQAGWESTAAYIRDVRGAKRDWNEAWQRGQMTEKDFARYRYNGALLLAENAQEKALLMYERRGRSSFHFGFEDQLYWFELDLDKYNKARAKLEDDDDGRTDKELREAALVQSGMVREIANCLPVPLYYQRDSLTDESWYYFRVSFPHAGRPVKNTFTSSQLNSASAFKERLRSIAPGASFSGNTLQLDRMLEEEIFNIKVVDTLPYVGYSLEHDAYVFGDVAVKEGRVHRLNDEDYFDLGALSLKTLNKSIGLCISPDAPVRQDWVPLLWQCYGPKGLVTLAFWAGSLLAEQIRAWHKQFPFLEMSGEGGTGKSTLIDFLWKLVGRTGHEGIDPSKSSLAGRMRHMTQVSNLPVVLIESDRGEEGHARRFDFEELKPLFNGRIGRSIGVKNAGNDTHDPPFRGTLVIEQNAPVEGKPQVLTRIVQMTFDKSRHSPENKRAADVLTQIPVESVSGFALTIARQADALVAQVKERFHGHMQALLARPDVREVRIAETHGLLMTLLDVLAPTLGLNTAQVTETLALLGELAAQRQAAINADHPYVVEFWERFDYLDGKPLANGDRIDLDHSRDSGLIAVNLVEFESCLSRNGLHLPCPTTELKRLLRTSKRRRFIEASRSVNSITGNGTRRCWIFQREGA
ncbi:MAG: toprim domain-containing protein [Pseudomonadota bacterium]|nr:toprim domain-containing protein [Pseudomonadota bacterium]